MATVLVCNLSAFLFFHDTSTTDIYTLSLHDALPICAIQVPVAALDKTSHRTLSRIGTLGGEANKRADAALGSNLERSEEHTSELQSHSDLVCRLLLEKKKKKNRYETSSLCYKQSRNG